MGKRFTDTDKWANRPWFRKLSPTAKLLWLYMCDSCDVAGVIDLDLDMVSFLIGCNVTDSHLGELSKQMETLDCGKLWIVDFVDFQYGNLSPDCRPHTKVISLLKGYTKGIHTLFDRVKDKDKEEDKDKDKEEEGTKSVAKRFTKPTVEQVAAYCEERGNGIDAEGFVAYYERNGWVTGKASTPMKSWKAAVIVFEKDKRNSQPSLPTQTLEQRYTPTQNAEA